MSQSADAILPRAHHRRGLLLMLFSTACFTTNVLIIRAMGQYENVNAWLVSCMRFLVGIGVLATVYRHQVRFPRVFRQKNLAIRGVMGGLGVAVYYITVVHLGAGRATFINNSYIIFGALLAVWMLNEPFRGSLAIGGVGAMVGLALLTNVVGGGFNAGVYDLLAVASAIGSAYVVVTIRKLHAEGEHTSTIFAAQCVYGLIICTIPAAMHAQPVSMLSIVLMLIAGICAAAGQLSMTRAFHDVTVAEGSLLQILVPLGIAAGGFAFFHEHFTTHELIGAGLILAGTVFTVAWK